MKNFWKKISWLKVFPVVLFAGIIVASMLKAFTTDEISVLSISVMFACCAICYKLEIKKYESAKLEKLIDSAHDHIYRVVRILPYRLSGV